MKKLLFTVILIFSTQNAFAYVWGSDYIFVSMRECMNNVDGDAIKKQMIKINTEQPELKKIKNGIVQPTFLETIKDYDKNQIGMEYCACMIDRQINYLPVDYFFEIMSYDATWFNLEGKKSNHFDAIEGNGSYNYYYTIKLDNSRCLKGIRNH